MRVLVANIPLPQNRFLVDLNLALSNHLELRLDHEAFWSMAGNFDVVHFHFPEYMTYEIQDAYVNGLTDEMFSAIKHRLVYWSQRAVLLITRHVLLPHDAVSDARWEKLYETVYRYVDGVVHFAEPSIEEFKKRYAETAFIHGHPRHYIVPHHNYTSLPNKISRKEARRQLGIGVDTNVVLIFGSIRNEEERCLILDSFKKIQTPNKHLLVSRWREKLANVSWIRLKYWLRDLKRLYYRVHPHYHFNYAFVEEEDAQIYMNAADVLLIPRLHVLNSGNVTMGMTFGKVVVGPDSLDVGHLLKSTGNVTFDPDHPETCALALEQALELAKQNQVGQANKELALGEWSPEQCAGQYFEIFEHLLEARKSCRPELNGSY